MRWKKMKKMKCICKSCKSKLTEHQKNYGWKFGKIWFCGNACATGYAVEEVLKLKSDKK